MHLLPVSSAENQLSPDGRTARWIRFSGDGHNWRILLRFITFQKKSKVQHLIHQLKYKGRMDVGIYLGKLLGTDLVKTDTFKDVTKVIPVPLHPGKQRKRGYNQSEQIRHRAGKSHEYRNGCNFIYPHRGYRNPNPEIAFCPLGKCKRNF